MSKTTPTRQESLPVSEKQAMNIQAESPALEATIRQRRAADPQHSVWVGASAGTGKTKVLTDRVLRLLLPRPDGRPATEPNRILCLTFTKAAAAEMAVRVNERLAKWAVSAHDVLEDDLAGLIGSRPDEAICKAARRLFGQVIDVPGGLKIMTIHSFCQSVLGRFPIEAGIAPNFEVLEENAAGALQQSAREQVMHLSSPPDLATIENDQKENNSLEKSSSRAAGQTPFSRLAGIAGENELLSALASVNSERGQLMKALEAFPSEKSLRAEIAQIFNVPEDFDPSLERARFCCFETIPKDDFRALSAAMEHGSKTIKEASGAISNWLESDQEDRLARLSGLIKIFLTNEGTLRTTRGFPKKRPESYELFSLIGEAIMELQDHINSCICALCSYDLICLGRDVQEIYEKEKTWRGVLDFDDMIRLTRNLLTDEKLSLKGASPSQWVLFKLDGGLDHILVDEAQDTNPEQWEIIEKLSEEFFSGQGARGGPGEEIERSIFVVGDEKQSIYSFQRADPDAFHKMRSYFQDKIRESGLEFENVSMNTSFRSTRPVLNLVDAIFDTPAGRAMLGLDDSSAPVTHKAHRSKDAGRVELWPLNEAQDKQDFEPWSLPVTTEDSQSAKGALAKDIAEQIRTWLDKSEILPSRGRPVRAGDIMILVRTRSDFVPGMIRELKTRFIEVNGMDRMRLSKELVVEDLLTLADFAVLPEDDLALATVLKSPLIGWSDEQLYDIAYQRPGTLWSALRQSRDGCAQIIAYLETMIARAAERRPYDFFAALIHDHCPADPQGSARRAFLSRLGIDALDPMDEFISACLRYERSEIPSLQGFISWQRHHEQEIKRETEDNRDQVRIMTVHGAKGLEAPIVFLPDTVRTGQSRKSEKLLWPNRTGLNLPLFSPRKEFNCRKFLDYQQELASYQEKEAQRLLYVALTRAEDRLIICGAEPARQSITQDSWYGSCEQAFETLDGIRKEKNAVTGRQIRIHEAPQRRKVEEEHAPQTKAGRAELPDWALSAPAAEPEPPRPLSPSRPSVPEQAVASPHKSGEDDIRFQRGNLTHKLLEHLPDLPADKRRAAAENYLANVSHALSRKVLDEILDETFTILNHKDYAPIFGPGSRAEVPVSGLQGRSSLVSGVIDRLLITSSSILIVDYKTNRPPPQTASEVPEIYLDQLRSYRDILSRIYPDRKISCALIWTDGPDLMDLTEFL